MQFAPGAGKTTPPIGSALAGARPIRDTIVRSESRIARAARARSAASVGSYLTPTGESVKVVVSDAYQSNPSLAQDWANYLSRLPHGSELSLLTLYFASPAEMTTICGENADGCYIPATNFLVAPAQDLPDGTPYGDVVVHEYGHHLANNRKNPPWSAFDRGPKRWSSYLQVCSRTAARAFFPGDEGSNYRLNPGEGFGEAYRITSHTGVWVDLVDPVFLPNARASQLILADALRPWNGNSVRIWHGALDEAGHLRQVVHPRLDGTMQVTLFSPPGADFDLVLRGADSKVLASSHAKARKESARLVVCGQRRITVEIRRVRGAGPFMARISMP